MLVHRTGNRRAYIELHKDAIGHWFIERLSCDRKVSRGGLYLSDYDIVQMVIQCGWTTWDERPWLRTMVTFLKEYLGEELFILVTLENL